MSGNIFTKFKGFISEGDPLSSRRLITLIISAVFVLSCLTFLILVILLFTNAADVSNINTKALEILANLFQEVMYYEFMIIISGLGFITMPQFAKALKSSLTSMVKKGSGIDNLYGNMYEENPNSGNLKEDDDGNLIG